MKKLTPLILIATLASGFPFSFRSYGAIDRPARGVRTSGEFTRKLRIYEEFVKQQMELEHIPGLTVGFVKDGYMWVKGFGYADLENKVRATSQSSYRLASITKSMTAVAILQLVEQGKISVRDSVQKFVPGYPFKGYTITIENLLTHTSGIRDYLQIDYQTPFLERWDFKPGQLIDSFKTYPLDFKPGTKFSYSNSGY